jgi:lysozyme
MDLLNSGEGETVTSDDPLKAMLIRHEGQVKQNNFHVPYDDKTGKPLRPGETLIGCLTICIGRNISEVGLNDDEALLLLQNDIERVYCELNQALPWWNHMDEVRRAVIVSLGFNLGVLTPPGKAKLLTFTTTLGLIEHGKYTEAADRLLTLPWAKQVGQRATELTDMLRTGKWKLEG